MEHGYCLHCMEPLTDGSCKNHCAPHTAGDSLALRPGTVLNGRYLVGRALGRGGFGITYIGRDLTLDIRVAVKEFFPGGMVVRNSAASPEVIVTAPDRDGDLSRDRDRFLSEARSLARFIGEKGIVEVRDHFLANNTAYIVMEYVDGQTLQEYLNQHGAMPPERALSLLAPVMDALDKVHQAGLIHRDISPDNILLTTGGQAKLLDFGTARGVNLTGEKSLSVIVKPGYAPEEQYRRKGSQGPWTDVYSLSATIYKCVTGITPEDSLQRVFQDTVQPPSQLGVAIDPGQEAALMKGMARYREDRFQSVRELTAALRGAGAVQAADAPDGHTVLLSRSGGRPRPGAAAPAPEPPDAPAGPRRPLDRTPGGESGISRPVPGPEDASGAWQGPAELAGPTEPAEPAGPVGPVEPKAEQHRPPAEEPAVTPKKKTRRLMGLVIGAAAVFALVIGAFVFWRLTSTVTIGNRTYTNDDYMVHLSNVTVNPKDIQKLARLDGLETVSFFMSEVSDECIAALSRLPQVKRVELEDCTGFTSVDPLADMESLETLLLYNIELPPVTADFPDVTWLAVGNMDYVENLDFLSHFPHVTRFNFTLIDNKLPDYSPIGQLTELEHLDLGNSGVSDLSFLAGLTELTELYADNDEYLLNPMRNEISDISALAACTKLTTLELQNNRIASLEGLENCTQLYTVDLSGNEIASLAPLSGCERLNTLKVSGNRLQALEGLENSPELRSLYLSNNRISDLSPLAGTAKLQIFYADGNRIESLLPLAANENLHTLRVGYNELTSLEGCEAMLRLERLTANDNHIADLGGISNCTGLTNVQLSYNELADIGVLGKNGENLTFLEAAQNRITSLAGLERCTQLQVLNCGGNRISDISPLSGAAELAGLRLADNLISDISALGALTKLAYLDLSGNRIDSISALQNCTGLSYIDLSGNQISDLSPLSGISGTYPVGSMVANISGFVLYLEHNRISDLSALPGEVTYWRLSLYDNPVAGCARLAELDFTNAFAAAGLLKGIYLGYRDGLDVTALGENDCRTFQFAGVPMDRRLTWENAVKGKSLLTEVNFYTQDELDALVAADKPSAVEAVGPEHDPRGEPLS